MANYETAMVFRPELPEALVSESELEFLTEMGIDHSVSKDMLYFFASEGARQIQIGSHLFDSEDVYNLMQDFILRSKGELSHIQVEIAYTCDRMASDGFGGGAIFITADKIEELYTGWWLADKAESLKKKEGQ